MTKKHFFKAAVLVSATAFLLAGCVYATRLKQAKQSEAKTYLASIYTASVAYFGDYNTLGKSFESLGWSPVSETTYSYYYLSCDEVIPSSETGYKGCPPALKKWFEECPKQKLPEDPGKFFLAKFCAAAVGNLDKDPELDVWVIDFKRTPTLILAD